LANASRISAFIALRRDAGRSGLSAVRYVSRYTRPPRVTTPQPPNPGNELPSPESTDCSAVEACFNCFIQTDTNAPLSVVPDRLRSDIPYSSFPPFSPSDNARTISSSMGPPSAWTRTRRLRSPQSSWE
jgi:hypothetical protein